MSGTEHLPKVSFIPTDTVNLEQLENPVPAEIALAGLLPEVQTALVTGARVAAVQEHAVRQVRVADYALQNHRTRRRRIGRRLLWKLRLGRGKNFKFRWLYFLRLTKMFRVF